jgi:hypothetical protein
MEKVQNCKKAKITHPYVNCTSTNKIMHNLFCEQMQLANKYKKYILIAGIMQLHTYVQLHIYLCNFHVKNEIGSQLHIYM